MTTAEPPAPAFDAASSIAYLRERGVEVELPEERAAAKAAAAAAAASGLPPGPPQSAADGVQFSYVRIPADSNVPVETCSGIAPLTGGDVLQSLLAPAFADDGAMDEATVARETAARLKGMLVGGGGEPGSAEQESQQKKLVAPSAAELQRLARGGVCEAWPLAQAHEDNGWRAVRFYIDETGALRGRPRNARAEALAGAAGLGGVSFHGDTYVGRCQRIDGAERNVDFAQSELSHDSEWIGAARRANGQAAASAGIGDTEHLASGGDGDGGTYSWTQGEEDVEVKVSRGIPQGGKAAKKRVAVSYGRGESLVVKVDGTVVFEVSRLFDRVIPDECSWSLGDGGALVISMEKSDARPWASLELPGNSMPFSIDSSMGLSL